jgi:hypothetical protein
MQIDSEDLRQHYRSLSDAGLLDIGRSDLTPMAQRIYDKEIARRGLSRSPAPVQQQEEEDHGYHRPLPVFTQDAGWDHVTDTDHPPPAWLEDAACPWSAYVHPNVDYMATGAEVQAALQQAGIPSRIVVRPPEPEPPQAPRSLYCVMVPGELGARAYSVVERKVFNRQAVAEWQSQLQSFSDEELRALNPEDFWGTLLERAESMKRAYRDEMARRNLRAVSSSEGQ